MRIVLNIPGEVDLSEFELKMAIGSGLYEKGIMSSGLAAEIVGIDRDGFLNNMGDFGKTVFEKPEKELIEDREIAKSVAFKGSEPASEQALKEGA